VVSKIKRQLCLHWFIQSGSNKKKLKSCIK
jgi:hypothetical protein